MLDALRSHWELVCDYKPSDVTAADRFLHDCHPSFDFQVTPPRSSCYASFLAKVAHSAPGADGLPYAVWHASGPTGRSLRFETQLWLATVRRVMIDFNDGLQLFRPKARLPATLSRF